ncbi:MAG: Mur ligase, partial [Thermoanaerobaculia bacterium]
YLRGRAEGEVAAMIVDHLLAEGLSPEAIGRADSEMDAIRQALTWAREGDLLLLFTHSQRSAVISYLQALQSKGWSPGDPVPGTRSQP